MRLLILPVLALALAAFAVPASAECFGEKHKDQTAEQPVPEPLPTPST